MPRPCTHATHLPVLRRQGHGHPLHPAALILQRLRLVVLALSTSVLPAIRLWVRRSILRVRVFFVIQARAREEVHLAS